MGQLVLLACGDRANAADVTCVALGVFIGDELFANTLDPEARVWGLPQTLSGTQIDDPNMLLAPIRIITPLFMDSKPPQFYTLADLHLPPDILSCNEPQRDYHLPMPLEVLCNFSVRQLLCMEHANVPPNALRDWHGARGLMAVLDVMRGERPGKPPSDADRRARVDKLCAHLRSQPPQLPPLGAAPQLPVCLTEAPKTNKRPHRYKTDTGVRLKKVGKSIKALYAGTRRKYYEALEHMAAALSEYLGEDE